MQITLDIGQNTLPIYDATFQVAGEEAIGYISRRLSFDLFVIPFGTMQIPEKCTSES